MFTGIITDVGKVVASKGESFTIATAYVADTIDIGVSICCDGCCLTVTSVEKDGAGSRFTVDVSNETRSKTSLAAWTENHPVNLERSLKLGAEMGGHVVTGHVDGTARVVDIADDGESRRFTFEVPEHLAIYIAPKGSIALDGTSLTVNEVRGTTFGVNLIPHTLTVTTWGATTPDQIVNLEVDLFARYVARLMEFRK
ncbi:MAG: riboflavin synthase [Pseudomonadota bacterium]